ncbi:hypothetical protein U9M48_041577 [Paspalum notatum var. saurae]|uniref:CCHC-type domain-containing protein n=1 Tax=Paspalum notatum var. saurae TaxID=547442 RepID=A0AAQ3UNN3_PASNO
MGEFMRLKPPSFAGSHDPLEAEDRIRTTERKLEIVNCDGATKVALATHQLTGSALSWWEAFHAAKKGVVTWKEFEEAFRQHHVPKAVRDKKAEEFRNLTQGNMSMQEYIQKFTELSRYTPSEVNSDDKKCENFIRGLTPEIKTLTYTCDYNNFSMLLNRVIKLEEGKKEEKSHLKRKFMEIKNQRQDRQFRQRSFGGQASRGPYGGPPRNTMTTPTCFGPAQSNAQTQQTTARDNGRACYTCGDPSHFMNSCPLRGKPTASTFSNPVDGPKQPTTTRNRPVASSQSVRQPQQSANKARVNHIDARDARRGTGRGTW